VFLYDTFMRSRPKNKLFTPMNMSQIMKKSIQDMLLNYVLLKKVKPV